jgi:hypothetical protein
MKFTTIRKPLENIKSDDAAFDEFLKVWGCRSPKRILGEYHELLYLGYDDVPFCQWIKSYSNPSTAREIQDSILHEGVDKAMEKLQVRLLTATIYNDWAMIYEV